MFPLPHTKGKKYGVFGLGKTGLATCRALTDSGAEAFCWDEVRGARQQTEGTKFEASHPKEWPWAELAAVVVSPGVPLTHPKPHVIVRKARQENVPVTGDLDLFAAGLEAIAGEGPRVIAVTGSNGKSTTTALIGHLLKEAGRKVYVGGNIGDPILELPAPSADATYVLELSSYQLDLATQFRPNTSVFLNISEDHLDRHGSMENYIAAKRKIFQYQDDGDTAVIGIDDDYSQVVCASLSEQSKKPTILQVSSSGALGSGVFALDDRLYYRLGEKVGEVGDLTSAASLSGPHNAQNAAAALAVAIVEGLSPPVVAKSLERFRGLPHRSEVVAVKNDVHFINDSKATNVAATAASLKSYDSVYWIAGGVAKDSSEHGEGGMASLVPCMSRVAHAYFYGEAADHFEQALGSAVTVTRCKDLTEAVAKATADALANDLVSSDGPQKTAVLLAPAAASFDQFKNFEERGTLFRTEVLAQLEAFSADAQNASAGLSSGSGPVSNGAAA